MRPIDADFCKELGATCIATRNKNGDLVAIASLDLIPTMYKCETCVHEDDHAFDEPCAHCEGGHLWLQSCPEYHGFDSNGGIHLGLKIVR